MCFSADLDPIYYCELIPACPIKDDGDAKFTAFQVNPKSGPQGQSHCLLTCRHSVFFLMHGTWLFNDFWLWTFTTHSFAIYVAIWCVLCNGYNFEIHAVVHFVLADLESSSFYRDLVLCAFNRIVDMYTFNLLLFSLNFTCRHVRHRLYVHVEERHGYRRNLPGDRHCGRHPAR